MQTIDSEQPLFFSPNDNLVISFQFSVSASKQIFNCGYSQLLFVIWILDFQV